MARAFCILSAAAQYAASASSSSAHTISIAWHAARALTD